MQAKIIFSIVLGLVLLYYPAREIYKLIRYELHLRKWKKEMEEIGQMDESPEKMEKLLAIRPSEYFKDID